MKPRLLLVAAACCLGIGALACGGGAASGAGIEVVVDHFAETSITAVRSGWLKSSLLLPVEVTTRTSFF